MAKLKPIEGNRKHEVEVNGADARAMETAAAALEGKDDLHIRQAESASNRLRDVAKRFRQADRGAARKAKKK